MYWSERILGGTFALTVERLGWMAFNKGVEEMTVTSPPVSWIFCSKASMNEGTVEVPVEVAFGDTGMGISTWRTSSRMESTSALT